MFRKIGFALLWVGFVSYAVVFAPPDQPDTLDLIINLSSGKWEGVNPLIISLFNLMGVWPAIYACVMLIDGRGQKIPAWPFTIGSFFVGAFAVIPYLALRQSNREFTGEKTAIYKFIDSRIIGIILAIPALVLLWYGFSNGSWSDFVQQWQTSRFIHVMSLDFCMLCLLFPALLSDDLARRGINNPLVFWLVALIPLLGPLAYLSVRPRLLGINTDTSQVVGEM